MKLQEPDNRIQQLFSEQRAADQRRAPSFQQTWQAAVTRAEEPAWLSWWLPATVATSVALLVIVSALLWQRTEKPQPTATATVLASITEWTAPTDSLLEPLSWSASTGSQP